MEENREVHVYVCVCAILPAVSKGASLEHYNMLLVTQKLMTLFVAFC